MTLPTFLVIGAQKAATTSLHAYVGTHPDVAVPSHKELDFFSRHWDRGADWYETQLSGEGRAVGEASPSYAAFPFEDEVPARIKSLVPDVRLIYLVRHPIERMQSSYLHSLHAGTERRPISKALLDDAWYVHLSSYALQLERYLEHFPREQILVIRSEDLAARPQAILSRVFDFIGVDPAWVPPNLGQRLHVSSVKRVPRRYASAAGTAMIWAQVRLLRRPYHPDSSDRPAWVEQYLCRPVQADELLLEAATRDTLARLLRSDLLRLRQLVGGEFDLWGLV